MNVTVVFLLGSGIAIVAGMPRVDDISEQVFSGNQIVRRDDGTYYRVERLDPEHALYRQMAEPAIAFVRRLRDIADRYFRDVLDGRSANYEDVANLAKQVADANSGEYENPALLPLLAELKDPAGNLHELQELAIEAHGYIRDMVWRLLERSVDHKFEVDHLAAITDGCQALGSTDLFELNHDGVLDHALTRAGIDSSDGLTDHDGDVRWWTGEFAHQHYFFHEALQRAEAIIVIGYGFRDKAINSRLIGWMSDVRDRRLIVVHGDPETLAAKSRRAISCPWEGWKKNGRLRIVNRWVADVTWNDIDAHLKP